MIKVQKKWIEDETGILNEITRVVKAIDYAGGKVTVEKVAKELKVNLALLTEFMTRPDKSLQFSTRLDKKNKREIIGIIKHILYEGTTFEHGETFKKKGMDFPIISILSRPLEMLWPEGIYYEVMYNHGLNRKRRGIISVEQLQEDFEAIEN